MLPLVTTTNVCNICCVRVLILFATITNVISWYQQAPSIHNTNVSLFKILMSFLYKPIIICSYYQFIFACITYGLCCYYQCPLLLLPMFFVVITNVLCCHYQCSLVLLPIIFVVHYQGFC